MACEICGGSHDLAMCDACGKIVCAEHRVLVIESYEVLCDACNKKR